MSMTGLNHRLINYQSDFQQQKPTKTLKCPILLFRIILNYKSLTSAFQIINVCLKFAHL